MVSLPRFVLLFPLIVGLLACGSAASTPADGGTTPIDGGTALTDGGATPADGGTALTDGGATPADGGTIPTDGGTTPTDGGTVPTDGGAAPLTIEILGPADHATFTANPIEVRARFSDKANIASASIKVNDTETPIDLTTINAQGEGAWSVRGHQGANTIAVAATDLAGQQVETSVDVTLSLTGPTVSIVAPLEGSVVTANPVAVQLHVVQPTPLAHLAYTLNGTTTSIAPAALDSDGNTTLSLSATEGTNTLAITATDEDGLEASDDVTFVLDTNGPTVSILSPTTGQVLTSSTVSVHARLTGLVALQSATLTLNGEDSNVELSQLDAQGELTVPVQAIEGSNTLSLSATDAAGRTATESVSFVLDTVGPIVHILSPASGAVVSGDPFTVTAELIGVAGLGGATLAVNGTETAIDPSTVDANHRVSLSAQAAEGVANITVTATDTLGRTASDSITLVVDATAPTFSLLAPVADFAETRRLLRGTATDNVGLSSIRYTLNDGAPVELPVQGHPASQEVSEVLDVLPGANTLVVTLTDQAGHTSTTTVPFRFGATVSSGGAHSASVRSGELYVWGRAGSGQTGLGTNYSTDASSPKSPVLLPFGAAGTTVESISLNQVSSLAIRSDGTVWMWGSNASGQVGTGSTDAKVYAPVQVPGITTARLGALGYDHSLVLLADGTVLGWGSNVSGQVGVNGTGGTSDTQPLPVQVQGLPTNIVKIAAGSAHSAALTADGHVFAWGRNQYANLGQGSAEDSSVRHPVPLEVPNLSDVIDVACGRDSITVLQADGTVSSWGLASSGALGTGAASGTVPTIAKVSTAADSPLTNVVAVFANAFTGYALLGTGELYGWGSNSSGSLALGATTPASQPYATHVAIWSPGPPTQYFDSLFGLSSIGVGALQTIVETNTPERDLYAWGWSFDGSLGVGAGASSTWAQTTPLYVTFPAPAPTP